MNIGFITATAAEKYRHGREWITVPNRYSIGHTSQLYRSISIGQIIWYAISEEIRIRVLRIFCADVI